eukprot:2310791-Amphidinium_carterae.1
MASDLEWVTYMLRCSTACPQHKAIPKGFGFHQSRLHLSLAALKGIALIQSRQLGYQIELLRYPPINHNPAHYAFKQLIIDVMTWFAGET